VKARPTFHYRLPNCDIGNPDWNLDLSIEMWMAVEALATHKSLDELRDSMKNDLEKILPSSTRQWVETSAQHLKDNDLFPAIVDRMGTV
jgi:hypothetical protein